MTAYQANRQVETATKRDRQQVVDTLSLAFVSDPMMRYFFPSPHDYVRNFPEFATVYGGRAFDHGTAHYVEGFAAAALWLPPGVQPDEDEMVSLFEDALPEDRLEVAYSVIEQVDALRPDEPYWHLPVIGTEPTRQRRGYGSALMSHVTERCDEEGETAFLESSNPTNISLYVRHGFEVVDVIREGSMPPLIPMVREPRG